MKKLLLSILSSLIFVSVFGQEYRDTIINNNGDIIVCTIRSIDKKSIDYVYSMDGQSRTPGKVNISDISYWSWNTNKQKEKEIVEKSILKKEVNTTVDNSSVKYVSKITTYNLFLGFIPITIVIEKFEY